MKKRGRPRKVTTFEISSSNPFTIKTDISYNGYKKNAQHIDTFIETLNGLPVSTTSSINIPVTIFPTKQLAANFFLAVKRELKSRKSNVVLTSKAIFSDDKKKYLGMRIWRVK